MVAPGDTIQGVLRDCCAKGSIQRSHSMAWTSNDKPSASGQATANCAISSGCRFQRALRRTKLENQSAGVEAESPRASYHSCASILEAGISFNVCWDGDFPSEGVSVDASYDPINAVLTITNEATNETVVYDTIFLHRIA